MSRNFDDWKILYKDNGEERILRSEAELEAKNRIELFGVTKNVSKKPHQHIAPKAPPCSRSKKFRLDPNGPLFQAYVLGMISLAQLKAKLDLK